MKCSAKIIVGSLVDLGLAGMAAAQQIDQAGNLPLVSDQWPGREHRHIERLTEAFYRLAAPRKRNTGGLGLGLCLCQTAIEARRGSLKISGEPGSGTRVECCFPAL